MLADRNMNTYYKDLGIRGVGVWLHLCRINGMTGAVKEKSGLIHQNFQNGIVE